MAESSDRKELEAAARAGKAHCGLGTRPAYQGAASKVGEGVGRAAAVVGRAA
jgi:hypothetical protein